MSFPSRLQERFSFESRLLASVVAALAVAGGGFSYLVGEQLLDAGVREGIARQRAEADQLAERARTAKRLQFELSRIVDELARQPDVLRAEVLNPDGVSLARSSGFTGELDHEALGRFATRSGHLTGRLVPAAAGRPEHMEFVASVPAGDGYGYVLVIDRDTAWLRGQIATVRRTMALIGGPAAMACLILMWLIGGRVLSRRHRRAIERATRDPLTDLGNHRAFADEIEIASGTARREGGDFALVVFDIDQFKVRNDRHGHQHGDDVLRRAGDALRATCRVEDRAFRVGGDEFVVIAPRARERDGVVLAGRMLRALAADGVTSSAGVSASRPGMRDGRQLREEADAALYEAKRARRGEAVGFSSIRDHVTVRTPQKVDAVRRLIDERLLDAAFQPSLDLERNAPLGVEALARPRPELGLSGPAEAFECARSPSTSSRSTAGSWAARSPTRARAPCSPRSRRTPARPARS